MKPKPPRMERGEDVPRLVRMLPTTYRSDADEGQAGKVDSAHLIQIRASLVIVKFPSLQGWNPGYLGRHAKQLYVTIDSSPLVFGNG